MDLLIIGFMFVVGMLLVAAALLALFNYDPDRQINTSNHTPMCNETNNQLKESDYNLTKNKQYNTKILGKRKDSIPSDLTVIGMTQSINLLNTPQTHKNYHTQDCSPSYDHSSYDCNNHAHDYSPSYGDCGSCDF